MSEAYLETAHITSSERLDLVACIEAGVAAFAGGDEHGSNPHLLSSDFNAPGISRAKILVFERVAAWWMGWEESYLASKPDAREHWKTAYF